MPCPHYDIRIVQRSGGQSAVAAAAYQSGDRLFSEYDGEQKFYSQKGGIVHTEILLPTHASPEYADRNTLWNAVEASEKQWNAQLARRIVLALPREIPKEQYAGLTRDYCMEQFVSKGMIADFAIHDKGDGNPHAHILLTMRAMDENGKWLPKSRKVYELDENGGRIRLASGRWKSHKENTTDWNDRRYAEVWRQGWADAANRSLEANDRLERLDLRSYARQGIDKIPAVHMGPAVSHMEEQGIRTNIGNLNREIETANRLMQSIRQTVSSLKGWIAGLKEKKAVLVAALEQAREPTIPELLSRYLDLRSAERVGWTSKGKLKGTVADFGHIPRTQSYGVCDSRGIRQMPAQARHFPHCSRKIQSAMSFLREKEISTVENLDAHLDEISRTAVSVMESVKKSEKRMKAIDTMLAYIDRYEKYKSVHAEYAAIGWKKKKEKFAESHCAELDAYNAAIRYFKANLEGTAYARKDLESERLQISAELPGQRERMEAVMADAKTLRDVRDWLNQVLPPEQRRATAEPGKKSSVAQKLEWKREAARQRETQEQRQIPKKQRHTEL